MRILQVHNFYQQQGGEDTVLMNEEKLLTKKGHHVWQYALHNQTIPETSKFQVATDTLWNTAAYRVVRQKIAKHGIDVMHVHNTFPLVSPAVYYAAHAEKVPVVQTLHNYRLLCPAATFFREGALCEKCMGKFLPWPGIVHRCYRENTVASAMTALMLTGHRAARTYSSKVDIYIAPSQFSLSKFVEGGLPRERLRMKHNFVLDDPGLGSGHGEYALFVGRLTVDKGLRTLLRAWSSMRGELQIKIAGDGPLRDEVQAAAQTNPRIEYLGHCSHARVMELMRNAALLIFPSEWYECSPLSVMEAMACGTPVLAADFGSLPEMVVTGENGALFSVKDRTHSLREAAERLFAKRDYLNSLRYSTRQYYELHFSQEPNYKALSEIYRSLMPVQVR